MLGHLSRDPLAHILRELHFSASSGQLTLRRQDQDRRIFFQTGEIVLLSSSAPEERVGEFLFSERLIAREVLDLALAESAKGNLFGQFLVHQGYLTPQALEEGLIRFQAYLLARFMVSSDWSYAFVEGEVQVPASIAFTIPFANLFLRASRQVRDREVLLKFLGGEDQLLGFSRNPRQLFQNFTLAPDEYYTISRIQGTTTVREVLTTCPADKVKCLQILFALTAAGILARYTRDQVLAMKFGKEISPTALNLSVEAPKTGTTAVGTRTDQEGWHRDFILAIKQKASRNDHYELLDLAPGATFQDVYARYLEYSKLVHPDNAFKPFLADLKPLLVELSSLMDKAFDTLSQVDKRSAYDHFEQGSKERDSEAVKRRQLQQEIVRRNFEKAKEYMEEEDWHSAYKLLKDAHQFEPNNPEILMALARVEVRNPHWVRFAAERLLTFLKENPAYEDAWMLLAQTYLAQNLPKRASFYLEKVLEINPRHEEAKALLRKIEKEKT